MSIRPNHLLNSVHCLSNMLFSQTAFYRHNESQPFSIDIPKLIEIKFLLHFKVSKCSEEWRIEILRVPNAVCRLKTKIEIFDIS